MAGCGNRSCGEVAPALSVEGQFGLRAFLAANLIGNPKIQYMTNKAFLALIYGLMGVLSLQAQELIPYRKGDRWGFCTPDKKVVVPPKYDYAGYFREGLARVKLNGKWGYVDKTGREVIPPKYDDSWDFREGLARVERNGKRFYIKLFPDGRVVEYYDK